MENLKIKVNNESESKEVQELFFELGFEKGMVCGNYPNTIVAVVDSKIIDYHFSSSATELEHREHKYYKELTLHQLRDLVVLKRNDVGDATHENNHGQKLYKAQKGWYIYVLGSWLWNDESLGYTPIQLKPVEKKEMKEYLDKQQDGTYKLIKADGDCIDRDWIEIPTGAEKYIQLSGNNRSFYKNGFKEFWCSGKWLETACNKENLKTWNGFPILWQRNPEPKQAEFLVKTDNGYVLQVLGENAGGADVVRIPDGAEIAILASGVVYFWKSHFFNGGVHKDWVDMKEGWSASWYLKNAPSAITIWKRETLNDQVASAEEFKQPEDLPFVDSKIDIDVENLPEFKPFNNGPVEHDLTAFTNLGIEYPIGNEIKKDFPLNRGDINYRAAIAFNAIRGTDLTEDDVSFLCELLNSITNHYGA